MPTDFSSGFSAGTQLGSQKLKAQGLVQQQQQFDTTQITALGDSALKELDSVIKELQSTESPIGPDGNPIPISERNSIVEAVIPGIMSIHDAIASVDPRAAEIYKSTAFNKLQTAKTLEDKLKGAQATERAQLEVQDEFNDPATKAVFDTTTSRTRFATNEEIIDSNGSLVPVPSNDDTFRKPDLKQIELPDNSKVWVNLNSPEGLAKAETLLSEENGGTLVEDSKTTSSQKSAAGFAIKMQSANQVLDSLDQEFTSKLAAVEGVLPNALKSSKRKLYENAKRTFINSQLRDESGATINPSEFESAEQQYFPQVNDPPEVVQQKSETRKNAVAAMEAAAGSTALSEAQDLQIRVEVDTPRGKISLLPGTIMEDATGAFWVVEPKGNNDSGKPIGVWKKLSDG